MKKTKKIFGLILLLAIIGLAAWIVYKSKQKNIEYALTPVQRKSVTKTISANGTYLSKEKSQVSFRISGPLLEIRVDVGDKVKKGQVLARIDTGVLEDNLKSAEGTLASQKQILINMKNHEDSYSGAQRNAQRGAVESAQGAVDEIRRQLQYSSIAAPMDGVVAEKNINIGEIVQAGSPVLTIIKKDQMRVEAKVPEVDIAGVAVSQKVSIKFDAYREDQRFEGVVSEIDPASISVQNVAYYVVKIQIPNPDANFRYGMNCTVYDKTGQKDDVLAIGKWMIEKDADKKFVNVMANAQEKILEKREIQTGLEGNDGLVEIVSGLKESDQIATEAN